MEIEPFQLERLQSIWEHRVEYNLSESGIHPLTFGELTGDDPDALARLSRQQLGYTQTNGTIPLREKIAALYSNATPDNVLATNGTSEANFVSVLGLLEAGDELALMLPNYMQIGGIAQAVGARVRPFALRESDRWAIDLDRLRALVSSNTKMIAVCNPNNPTGSVLTPSEMESIVEIAARHDTWVLADEVYSGAELEGDSTSSFWNLRDRYSKIIVANGLSKAYALPGLRIGWVVAPDEIAKQLWSYRDYTTIAPGALSDLIAQLALDQPRRQIILSRTRAILQRNFPVIDKWVARNRDHFSLIAPQAGAVAFVRLKFPGGSRNFTEMLLREKSVLTVPGEFFGMDGFFRIGFGSPPDYLDRGLGRIEELVSNLSAIA
jgi:aspartate/methionine/tyrosine aminotransferase